MEENTPQNEEDEGWGPHVGKLAQEACAQAYRDALAAGHSVLVAEGNTEHKALYLKHPDGTSEFVKEIEPDVKIDANVTYKLK